MTENWGEIQGKLDLVGISGQFELFEFELSGFYCIIKFSLKSNFQYSSEN